MMYDENIASAPVKDAENGVSSTESKAPHRPDKYIWGIYFFLVAISLVELYSASSREVTAGHIMSPLFRHALLLGVGCLIMLGLQRVKYTVFKLLTWPIIVVSVLAAVYTMFFGDIINGARRSFTVFSVSIQPSEMLKFSIALLVAWAIGKGTHKVKNMSVVDDRMVWVIVVTTLLFCGLIINQGLTNSILIVAISLSMMLIGGISWKQFAIVMLVFAVLGGGYYAYSKIKAKEEPATEQVEGMPYDVNRHKMREMRMKYYFSQRKDTFPINSATQQSQYSFIAQANGGTFGVFPGNSREAARLPLAFSDYIYAIIVEDTGLMGGLFVLALYLLLLARGGCVGIKCKKVYPALLIIAMAVFVTYQALFHMAIVSGLFPVSGQPLPFISKGGSSVIISSVALGIMLSVSRWAPRHDEKSLPEEKNTADNPLGKL